MKTQLETVQAAAELWRAITSGDDRKRDAAMGALIYAPAAVRAIVTQRSGAAAARFYVSPEGQQEWKDQADWRALDSEPVLDDDDDAEDL